MMINFDTSKNERMIISKIARRAVLLAKEAGISYDTIDAEMDISAVHCNGCQLRLKDLLDADDFNFSHDVFGVRRTSIVKPESWKIVFPLGSLCQKTKQPNPTISRRES